MNILSSVSHLTSSKFMMPFAALIKPHLLYQNHLVFSCIGQNTESMEPRLATHTPWMIRLMKIPIQIKMENSNVHLCLNFLQVNTLTLCTRMSFRLMLIREAGSTSIAILEREVKRKANSAKVADEASTNRHKTKGKFLNKPEGMMAPSDTTLEFSRAEEHVDSSYLKDINRKYRHDILFLVKIKNKDCYVHNLGNELHFTHHFFGLSGWSEWRISYFWRDTVNCDLYLLQFYIIWI